MPSRASVWSNVPASNWNMPRPPCRSEHAPSPAPATTGPPPQSRDCWAPGTPTSPRTSSARCSSRRRRCPRGASPARCRRANAASRISPGAHPPLRRRERRRDHPDVVLVQSCPIGGAGSVSRHPARPASARQTIAVRRMVRAPFFKRRARRNGPGAPRRLAASGSQRVRMARPPCDSPEIRGDRRRRGDRPGPGRLPAEPSPRERAPRRRAAVPRASRAPRPGARRRARARTPRSARSAPGARARAAIAWSTTKSRPATWCSTDHTTAPSARSIESGSRRSTKNAMHASAIPRKNPLDPVTTRPTPVTPEQARRRRSPRRRRAAWARTRARSAPTTPCPTVAGPRDGRGSAAQHHVAGQPPRGTRRLACGATGPGTRPIEARTGPSTRARRSPRRARLAITKSAYSTAPMALSMGAGRALTSPRSRLAIARIVVRQARDRRATCASATACAIPIQQGSRSRSRSSGSARAPRRA